MPGHCRCSIEVKRGFSAGLAWRIEATAVGDNVPRGTQGQGLSGNVVEGACVPPALSCPMNRLQRGKQRAATMMHSIFMYMIGLRVSFCIYKYTDILIKLN